VDTVQLTHHSWC